MQQPDYIENIMSEIRECSKRRSRLILSQVDMALPQGQVRALIRSAVLNALGDSGLLTEIRGIVSTHVRELENHGANHGQ